MRKVGLFLLILLLGGASWQANAQKETAPKGPFETALKFTCINTSDDSILLKSVLSVKHEEGPNFLANAPVNFTIKSAENEQLVGQSKTNTQGIALFKVPARRFLTGKKETLLSFKSSYAGNANYTASDGEAALKPARLTVSFYTEDTVRFVKVKATQLQPDGKETPLGPLDVTVSVPRMFSMLKLAGISLDSTGTGTAEFPNNIIGDSLGNLTVVASVEDNDVFGNITGQAITPWGLHKHLISPDRPSRELWTPIAPLWMIITLIIMLSGVWGHYLYAVVQLILIKKSSKPAAGEKE